MQKEEEFECPWCGTHFKDGRELDLHAKNHYVKEVAAVGLSVVLKIR